MNRLKFMMPIVFLAVAAGFSAGIMLLWNWLMPFLFGLTVINFWQALGLLVLCRILFGGFGGWHRRRQVRGFEGMHHLREKWEKMTPEQRKEFVNRRRAHCRRGNFFGIPDFGSFETDENASKEDE